MSEGRTSAGVSPATRKRAEPYRSLENMKAKWATVKREYIRWEWSGVGSLACSATQCRVISLVARGRASDRSARRDAAAADPQQSSRKSSVKVGPDPPWGGGGGYIGPGPGSFLGGARQRWRFGRTKIEEAAGGRPFQLLALTKYWHITVRGSEWISSSATVSCRGTGAEVLSRRAGLVARRQAEAIVKASTSQNRNRNSALSVLIQSFNRRKRLPCSAFFENRTRQPRRSPNSITSLPR